MTPLDYDFLRKLVRERSGLVLSADKQYLVESRLLPVARKAGLAGLSELVQRLKGANAQALAVEVVEAMMTNESFFFRDKLPFEHFRDTIMPSLMAARARAAPDPDLVRRRVDRPGAVFAGDVPEGDGAAGCRLADRHPRHRPLERGARKGESRHLQPVRGPARPADSDAGQVFHAGRRDLADRARDPRHGAIPAVQPAERLRRPRHVRRRVLPQRADLFRPADQGRRARAHRAHRSSATAISCSARPRPWSASPTASSRSPTGAGLYAPNAGARAAGPRLAVVAGGR